MYRGLWCLGGAAYLVKGTDRILDHKMVQMNQLQMGLKLNILLWRQKGDMLLRKDMLLQRNMVLRRLHRDQFL